MTGTSADALDGCLVSFEKGFEFIAVSYTHLTLPTI